MSNIKLKDHYWETEGIYDTAQTATQKAINGEVVESARNIIKVQDTQPTSSYNKIWLPETVGDGVQVPTWAEHQALSNTVSALGTGDITNGSNVSGATATAALNTLNGAINGIRDLKPRAALGSSDDLNTFYGASATGVYYIGSGVINSPVAYRPLICIGSGNDGFQFIYGSNLLLVRMRTNNSWGSWTSLGQGMLSPYAETSMKATRNYSVNDTIAVNGMLYVAIVTIASGTTLEENTHVKRLVIGQSLNPIAQESTLTDALPNEGQSQYNQNYICKQNNIVNIRFRKYGMTARAGNGTVATIPDGYRPQKTQVVWGSVDRTDNVFSLVPFEISPSGSLSYYAASQSIVIGYWIIGTYAI